MQNATIGKIIAALAVLVLLIGIVLHFFGRNPEKTVTTAPAITKTQDLVSSEKFPHRHVAATPEMEAPDQTDHDEAILPKIPREKVEEYLTRNHRSVASLLAAFHELDDTNYLNEAAAKFPNDPQVQWTILVRDAFPEDRRKWLDLFKASSPDNAIANYFSAADYFKNGQSDFAIKELVGASGKNQFKDYVMEAMLDQEELSRASGRTTLESFRVVGWLEDLPPQMGNFKWLARQIGDARQQCLDAGDFASANNLVRMQFDLIDRLTTGEGGKVVINQLLGRSIESPVIRLLDQNTRYDFLGGKTPTERLAELRQEYHSFEDLRNTLAAVYWNLTETEMVAYHDRMKESGEIEALRWLQQRLGTNSPAPSR